MNRNSLRVCLIIVCLCFICLPTPAQTKAAVQDEQLTEKVDAFVREKMKSKNIPGLSLAVVRDGKIVLAKGYGMANLELSVSATEKTRFAIFSVTKTFTAVATMLLVKEGKISLEDPISKHLADLPAAWQQVTIRQMLSHTSGFADYRNYLSKLGNVKSDYAPAEMIKLAAELPLVFPSGTRWLYTETNFYLLGMLIEKVSGKTYEQFLTERIFAPLGMRDTRIDNSAELIPNRADGYTWQASEYRNAPRYSPTLTFSTAGLVSTVIDLAKWDSALATEKLVQKSTLEQMWTNARLNNGEIVPEYGLGFGLTPFRNRRRIGHVGGAEGFAAVISRFVDDNVTVIVLSNADQQGFTISDVANEIAAFYFPN